MYWFLTLLITVVGAVLGSAITLFAQSLGTRRSKERLVLNAFSELAHMRLRNSEVSESKFVLSSPVTFVHAKHLLQSSTLSRNKETQVLRCLTSIEKDSREFNYLNQFVHQMLASDELVYHRSSFQSAVRNMNTSAEILNASIADAMLAFQACYPEVLRSNDSERK